MPNLKIADAYIDLRIDRTQFDADLAAILAKIRGIGPAGVGAGLGGAIGASVAQGVAQGVTAGMSGAAAAAAQAQGAAIGRAIARGVAQGGAAGGRGGGFAGFGGFGGPRGGQFAVGLGQGFGLPFATNLPMMAGQLIGAGLTDAVETAIKLESDFTELQRVSDLPGDTIAGIKDRLLKLSTTQAGVSVQDLTEMATIGARAGIADQEGAPGLMRFTEALAKVRNAVQGIGTEQLANDIGKILGQFHLGTDSVQGFGSALTKMDNISRSSASDILSIAKGLSGTATSLQMTIPQLLAFSSALADAGLTNQLGASAFSQILRTLASNPEKFSKATGVDEEVYRGMINQGRPLDALGLVIAKFKEVNAVDPSKAQEFISELGFRGVRAGGALQQLSNIFEKVQERTAMANEEFRTLGSLLSADKLNTAKTEGDIQKLKNAFVGLKDAIGGLALGPIKMIAPAVTTAVTATTGAIKGGIAAVPGLIDKADQALHMGDDSIMWWFLTPNQRQQFGSLDTKVQRFLGDDPDLKNPPMQPGPDAAQALKDVADQAAAERARLGAPGRRDAMLQAIAADNARRLARADLDAWNAQMGIYGVVDQPDDFKEAVFRGPGPVDLAAEAEKEARRRERQSLTDAAFQKRVGGLQWAEAVVAQEDRIKELQDAIDAHATRPRAFQSQAFSSADEFGSFAVQQALSREPDETAKGQLEELRKAVAKLEEIKTGLAERRREDRIKAIVGGPA